jgi:AAA family ATP:ADP antiporter
LLSYLKVTVINEQDKDSKTKGKAAIDVLGARLGKSGAALVQQLLVVMLGSIVRGAPVIAVFFYLIIAAWISEYFLFYCTVG